MATFTAPVTQAQTQGTLGQAFALLGPQVDQALTDRFNVVEAGMLVPLGVVANTGSTTVRKRWIDGVGYAAPMTAVSETGAVEASGFDASYDDVTVARYAIAAGSSFLREIFGSDGLGIQQMAATHADSYMATLRSLLYSSFTGMANAAGTSGAALDTDDIFALIALYEAIEGFSGTVINLCSPKQITDLRTSLRAYAGLQFPEPTDRLQGLSGTAFAFDFLGMRFFRAHGLSTVSGDHIGGSYAANKFGFVAGDTSAVPVEGSSSVSVLPDWGLITVGSIDGKQAQLRVDTSAFVGVGAASDSLIPGYRLRSVA
jgi:hypothetical protein